jgi:hypothetical protein
MSETFIVGQRVCMVGADNTPIRLLTVTALGKRKMTLSDNSEWRVDGCMPYGVRDTYYRGPYIRGEHPTDDEQIRTRNLARWLGNCPWGDLPLETLREIHRILRPVLEARGLIKPAG